MVAAALGTLVLTGCGQTRQQLATEQMLASDAVDRSVAQLDLSPLRDKTVYFDTQYIRSIKGAGFVNADYIVSSLRQQMFAAGCRLQDNREDAEVVIEGRVGVLGIDDHEITYGLPASNSLNTAASAAGTQIPLPALPELSIAKKNEQIGAAKVALFAYDRETREPVWQSGVNTSMSDSDAFWIFGAGPFRRGTIYRGMHLAGSRVKVPKLIRHSKTKEQEVALASYRQKQEFDADEPAPVADDEAAGEPTEPAVLELTDGEKAKPLKSGEQSPMPDGAVAKPTSDAETAKAATEKAATEKAAKAKGPKPEAPKAKSAEAPTPKLKSSRPATPTVEPNPPK